MTAKSNIISLRAYAKQKARLIGPAAPQDIRDRQWDTDDLKRLLFRAKPIQLNSPTRPNAFERQMLPRAGG